MFTILVNALSATNASGRYVLEGIARHVIAGLDGRARLVVLGRPRDSGLRTSLDRLVEWIDAPESTARWTARAAWERFHLARTSHAVGADVYFTPNGMTAATIPIPQIVYCQNPWAMVPEARRPWDAPKAWLQRHAYRHAMREATALVFNSAYMQEAYRANARGRERRGLVAHVGLDQATLNAADAHQATRVPGRIVCVSAMARHKNVETVLRALEWLHAHDASKATLHLVGSWPDAAYESRIRALVKTLGLSRAVVFAGFVSREQLHRAYAEASVFCLMSRCESFGIPAVEAQAFGTPVVSSNVCAVPEICGAGGTFLAPDDSVGVAKAVLDLIADRSRWEQQSLAARRNASNFTWERCLQPLVDLLREFMNA